MTDDELRVKIAKALGWKWHIDDNGGERLYDPSGEKMGAFYNIRSELRITNSLPNWPGDIAAMYELEKMIPEDQHHEYAFELLRIIGEEPRDTFEVSRWQLAHATPRQRAEAWLKWHERNEGGQ